MAFKPLSRALLAGAAMLTLSGEALALDGSDLLGKLNAAYGNQGGSIAAAAVEVDGETVVLRDARLTFAKTPADDYSVGDITLEGVEETEDGGYTIETLSIPDIRLEQENTKFTAEKLVMTGVRVPADATTGRLDGFLLYDSVTSGPIVVEAEGKPFFSVRETKTTVDVKDDESGLDFAFEAPGLSVNLADTQDPATREAIDKLGLNRLDGAISLGGSWEAASGTVDIREYAVDLRDVGRLDMAINLSGYTFAFMKAMQDTAKAIEANPNKEEAQNAAGLAMLGLAQQLTLNSAKIRFEDSGITRRGLDYAGSKQGVSGEQMGLAVKAMTPMVIAQWNMPTLQNSITTAVSAFIDRPGSFTISAKPSAPVAVPMIAGTAMGAPNTLPELLGVTVTAND